MLLSEGLSSEGPSCGGRRSGRRPAALLGLGLLAACVHRPAAAPPPIAAGQISGDACPTPVTDPPACTEAQAALGRTPENPLEWGYAAAGNSLWYDRLACADGSIPGVTRLGNIGVAPLASASPASDAPRFGGDVLDQWGVSCGEEQTLLYTNLYRCGALCVPSPFRLVPGATMVLVDRAQQSLQAERLDDVATTARSIGASAPGFEIAWVLQASFLQAASQPQEALEAWEGAARVRDSAVTRSHHAEVLAWLGRTTEARLEANELLARFGDTSLGPRLRCTLAQTESDPALRVERAAAACAEGYTLCCPASTP
jgi:hypothetical protein